MLRNKVSRRGGRVLVAAVTAVAMSSTNHASASEGSVRFSDQPAPLRLDDFPKRPAPLLELGDKFLGPGNLQRGFTLPTGAVWSPNFWVFGTFRSAIQTFDSGINSPGGSGSRTTEWANRLDLFGNLQLSPTERVVVGFRPLDQNGTAYTGYRFEPLSQKGFDENYGATPRTLFFEGEFGEIFPKLDKADSRSLDYGFAVGRQPLTLQDGLLVNDGSIDMVSITRTSLRVPGGSTLRVSGFFAWDQIERADNLRDKRALMYGIDAAADFSLSTVEADLVYVSAPGGGDGFYAGLGAIQRLGKINTTFRVEESVAVDQVNARVSNGTLLFGELSTTMPYNYDILYLNGFLAIDKFASADRDPTAGGPLGRVGILDAAVGIGRYGAPLSNQAQKAAGANLGYQAFFGELRHSQLVVEIGARAPTETPVTAAQQSAEGIGARFQHAFGGRFIWILDTFGVLREANNASYGARSEILVKF